MSIKKLQRMEMKLLMFYKKNIFSIFQRDIVFESGCSGVNEDWIKWHFLGLLSNPDPDTNIT